MSAPTPVPAKPAIVKEIPDSIFPKLQVVTKMPTKANIAPKTQVSKDLYQLVIILSPLKFFLYSTEKNEVDNTSTFSKESFALRHLYIAPTVVTMKRA
jgi:hypothetical protein